MAKAESETKPDDSRDLLNEIRSLIEEARRQTAAAVNAGLTVLYWRIGIESFTRFSENERATYGEQIVATLSRQLSWSHLKELLPLGRPHQKEFYAEMCRVQDAARTDTTVE